MSKSYYVDYINHCVRFYLTIDKDYKFDSDAERQNWIAVDEVLDSLSEKEKSVIIEIYGRKGLIPQNVKQLSREMHIKETTIWMILSKTTRKIAERRGVL